VREALEKAGIDQKSFASKWLQPLHVAESTTQP